MELSVLFDGAADFRDLSGGNQPSAILPSQHKLSLPKASISWRFQVVAIPATTLRTSCASFCAARTQLANKELHTATPASTVGSLRIAVVMVFP
jgi:hypothetical protein